MHASYPEGDRGYAFPDKYVWTQGNFSDGAPMRSIADIPLGASPGNLHHVPTHGIDSRLWIANASAV